MQEVILKTNNTSLRVYINGIPNLSLIPKDIAESAISVLELEISEYIMKEWSNISSQS
jgi:hypothetical protein